MTELEKELYETVVLLQSHMNALHNVQGLKAWAFRENIEIRRSGNNLADAAIAKAEGK
jgi:hypothetical protein